MIKKMRPEMLKGFQIKRWYQQRCLAHTTQYPCQLRIHHTIETGGVHANFSMKSPVYWSDEYVYFEES